MHRNISTEAKNPSLPGNSRSPQKHGQDHQKSRERMDQYLKIIPENERPQVEKELMKSMFKRRLTANITAIMAKTRNSRQMEPSKTLANPVSSQLSQYPELNKTGSNKKNHHRKQQQTINEGKRESRAKAQLANTQSHKLLPHISTAQSIEELPHSSLFESIKPNTYSKAAKGSIKLQEPHKTLASG